MFFLVSINRGVTFAPAKTALIGLILQTATGSLMVHNLLGKLLGLNMGQVVVAALAIDVLNRQYVVSGYYYYY